MRRKDTLMTLIVTMVSAVGIAHISDSNLSDESLRALPDPGIKVFEAKLRHTGVAIAGSYRVAGVPMDGWMTARIREYEADASLTVARFAESLRQSLDYQMTPEEKRNGSIVHVAGYARDVDGWHPEAYILSNIQDLDADTGDYLPPMQTFLPLEEKFWATTSATAEGREAFEAGAIITYVNGFAPGRVAYFGLQQEMAALFDSIWKRPGWKFRPPQNLRELAIYLRLHLNIVGDLFEMSDYPGQIIGGQPQIKLIPPPAPKP
jgi:hypothetical protein